MKIDTSYRVSNVAPLFVQSVSSQMNSLASGGNYPSVSSYSDVRATHGRSLLFKPTIEEGKVFIITIIYTLISITLYSKW